MKISKRIEIDEKMYALFLVNSENNTCAWVLYIKINNELIKVNTNSSTILSLLMIERNFKAHSTGFIEGLNI